MTIVSIDTGQARPPATARSAGPALVAGTSFVTSTTGSCSRTAIPASGSCSTRPRRRSASPSPGSAAWRRRPTPGCSVGRHAPRHGRRVAAGRAGRPADAHGQRALHHPRRAGGACSTTGVGVDRIVIANSLLSPEPGSLVPVPARPRRRLPGPHGLRCHPQEGVRHASIHHASLVPCRSRHCPVPGCCRRHGGVCRRARPRSAVMRTARRSGADGKSVEATEALYCRAHGICWRAPWTGAEPVQRARYEAGRAYLEYPTRGSGNAADRQSTRRPQPPLDWRIGPGRRRPTRRACASATTCSCPCSGAASATRSERRTSCSRTRK